MKRFLIHISALFIFILIVRFTAGPLIDYVSQTSSGYALVVVGWMALGWYWSKIYDYTEAKIKTFIAR